MSNFTLVAILLIVMAVAYQVGLSRSKHLAVAGGSRRMHSRPGYHGMLVALWCGFPALIVLAIWLSFEHSLLEGMIGSEYRQQLTELPPDAISAFFYRVRTIAAGGLVSGQLTPLELQAAATLSRLQTISQLAMIALMAAVAAAGAAYARQRISPGLRARNHVEKVVVIFFIACSAVAIMTTIGIVLSMLGEALHFFSFVSPIDFFFGTVWNPRFSSTGTGGQGDFGLLPLLWGTVLISIIAMLVAVPIGLMTAIYMAEYAGKRLRATAKPIIEVLAGIPTIVYGFFALTAVGPTFAEVGDALGLDIKATSAFTAGVVMGIMIIPFVSSLSDDIITQVPRAMRDGSLAMGATRSETIRKVLFPAALPGIVGAILLAVSRAIGETMIVVLAAGNSPVLQFNPFDAISTVTVTIVNQLTGDTDFASPQSLVAFALGLTLFVITLCLNVVALYIVRKYREQYE